MAKMIKKRCILCAKNYEIYCPTCKEGAFQPSWKNIFHDENCKNIFEACSQYNAGKMSAEDAKNILNNCDLSNKDQFTASTQRIIGEIYKIAVNFVEPEITVKVENIVEENKEIELVNEVAEEQITEVTSEPIDEVYMVNEPSAPKQYNYKRKKKKRNN